MAFPPTVGTNYEDPTGRRWTVGTVIESGFREVQMVPASGEGRASVGLVILEEEWGAWEALARDLTPAP